jgi:hypothetical protein
MRRAGNPRYGYRKSERYQNGRLKFKVHIR